MKLNHTFLAVSLVAFAAGFNSGDSIYLGVGLPAGAILFGLFMIFSVLEKEAALFDKQRRATYSERCFRPEKIVFVARQISQAGLWFRRHETLKVNMKTLEDAISSHQFLKDLNPRHLQTLVDSAMPLEFEANQTIFREGDPANRFYLIQSGKVALETSTKDREPTLIQTIRAGDVLGWSWLFPPYYWHFEARALEPTRAIFFYGSRLREQCEEDHDLGYELMKRMAGIAINRLQATRKQLLEVQRSH